MNQQRVGVLGGGQLAWMMGLEAQKHGISLWVQTPSEQDPAVRVAHETILAPLSDFEATATLAGNVDILTFENEFIDLPNLGRLRDQVTFYPDLSSVAPLLDKFEQRCYLEELGLPVPTFKSVIAGKNVDWDSKDFPLVVKSRRHGYDGQGTFIVTDETELETVWENLQGSPVLIEGYIPFEKELAVMAGRGVNGETVVYPTVETYQRNQVCHRVIAPARIPETLREQINMIAQTILDSLEWVGMIGIELFLSEDNQVLVNEIAPRTHNSGHYTLDACDISQFAMHLQAITGNSLTPPSLTSNAAVMVNLLGYEFAETAYPEKQQQLRSLPGAHLYWYGKQKARPGRKLGHVTVVGNSIADASAIADQVSEIWYPH